MTEPAMNCEDLVELVTDYLEDRLTQPDRARFEAHLGTCRGCEDYVEQIRVLLRMGASERGTDVGELVRRLLPAFRDFRRGLPT